MSQVLRSIRSQLMKRKPADQVLRAIQEFMNRPLTPMCAKYTAGRGKPILRKKASGLQASEDPRILMNTQGEIEAAICERISRFEQEHMGRGPKDIHAFLISDLVVVRLRGVLTAAEQQLVKSLAAEKGRDLLKQVRTHLIETARPLMETMIHELTGVKALSMHHDISTVTGEEIMVFTLAEPPALRETKKR